MTTQAEGVAALLLNVLILPGLGTLIWGNRTHGVWQVLLFAAGIPLTLLLIGIPLMLAAWIWALVSGIHLVQEAE